MSLARECRHRLRYLEPAARQFHHGHGRPCRPPSNPRRSAAFSSERPGVSGAARSAYLADLHHGDGADRPSRHAGWASRAMPPSWPAARVLRSTASASAMPRCRSRSTRPRSAPWPPNTSSEGEDAHDEKRPPPGEPRRPGDRRIARYRPGRGRALRSGRRHRGGQSLAATPRPPPKPWSRPFMPSTAAEGHPVPAPMAPSKPTSPIPPPSSAWSPMSRARCGGSAYPRQQCRHAGRDAGR